MCVFLYARVCVTVSVRAYVSSCIISFMFMHMYPCFKFHQYLQINEFYIIYVERVSYDVFSYCCENSIQDVLLVVVLESTDKKEIE